MNLESDIADIREKLSRGIFNNEAAVRSGIVMRLLRALGWPDEDPSLVAPEYSIGGRRVDFALCQRPLTPAVFLEVKPVGEANPTNTNADTDAEKQLFEYAFHQGVPIAVLAKGGRWSFYWPAGQGVYEERKIAKIDLSADAPEQCAEVLRRYLDYQTVLSNQAERNARSDHEISRKRREAKRALAPAWRRLLEQPHETLVDLLCREAGKIAGLPIERDDAIELIKETRRGVHHAPALDRPQAFSRPVTAPAPVAQNAAAQNTEATARNPQTRIRQLEFFGEKSQEFRTNHHALDWLLKKFADRSEDFMSRYSEATVGRETRVIARAPALLFTDDKPHEWVASKTHDMGNGWFMNKNASTPQFIGRIKDACRVAEAVYGKDVRIT